MTSLTQNLKIKLLAKLRNLRLGVAFVLAIGFLLIAFGLIYERAKPTRYNLSISSISDVDVTAVRDVPDWVETRAKASQAAASVPSVFVRSDRLSAQYLQELELRLSSMDQARENWLNADRRIRDESR